MNPKISIPLVNKGLLQHAVSTFCCMQFQFWIGNFLIKLQCIAVHFYLGFWKQPWFGPAGSENACVFHMRKWHVATKFNDIFKKRVRFFSSCKVRIDKKAFFPWKIISLLSNPLTADDATHRYVFSSSFFSPFRDHEQMLLMIFFKVRRSWCSSENYV